MWLDGCYSAFTEASAGSKLDREAAFPGDGLGDERARINDQEGARPYCFLKFALHSPHAPHVYLGKEPGKNQDLDSRFARRIAPSKVVADEQNELRVRKPWGAMGNDNQAQMNHASWCSATFFKPCQARWPHTPATRRSRYSTPKSCTNLRSHDT